MTMTMILIIMMNVIGQFNFSHVTYSNLIRYGVPSPSEVISRTTVYYVPVHCVLARQADPTNRIDPAMRTAPPMTGNGQLNVRLVLFQDNRFQVQAKAFFCKNSTNIPKLAPNNIVLLLVGTTSSKSLRLHLFKSNPDEVWRDCS